MRSQIGLLAAAVLAASAYATSVVRLPLTRIADLTGQIVVGEVRNVRSYWASNPRRIESVVTLHNVDFLKGGGESQHTLSFTVPGGTVGMWSARVAGAPEFRAGERWALCLLPTWKSFPTAGVHQGAFKFVSTEHGEAVIDGRGVPVTELDGGGYVVTTSAARGMPAETFIEQLRGIAKASTPCSLPPGAPVRVIPEYRSVPLVPAAESSGGGVPLPNGIDRGPVVPDRAESEAKP